jgi:starch synthase
MLRGPGNISADARQTSVLIASSEIAPYAKTGGLGDVMASLPAALARLGTNVSLVMPAYSSVLSGGYGYEVPDIHVSVRVADRLETAEILKSTTQDGLPIYFVRADRYFDRDFLYGTPDGDYRDNAERFVFFSRAALELARQLQPSVLHVNDWQTSMAIAFLRSQPSRYPELASVKTVMTVHNLGYQGRFKAAEWRILDLDSSLFTPRYLEFYGAINFLKGGIVFADAITTVSPTYAEEIKTPEQGFGLEGVFRERSDRLYGILNGVDYNIWNPQTDPFIARHYSLRNIKGKTECATDLRTYFGLADRKGSPIIGMVTRLSAQKGLDLVRDALDELLRLGCQFALLGSGDREFQESFRKLGRKYKGRVGVQIGFNETIAHKIIAGSDIMLLPSRYEPGGLTQLYGLKYGTIPVVRATGGLMDTIIPFQPQTAQGNGFLFSSYASDALVSAVGRAIEAYRQKATWARVVSNAMLSDFSWERSAQAYSDIYRKL